MPESSQSFESHAKIVPGYHRLTLALVALPMLYFGYRTLVGFSVERLALFLFSIGVLLTAAYARIFPVRVQNRVIRLEEQLRMQRVLPPDLRARIGELTTNQLIGLRFASDEELPELTRRVLDEGIHDRNQIKRSVRDWRPDHQRI